MRKTCILLIIFSLVLTSMFFPTSASGFAIYSTDAIRHFCTVWNDYFQQYEPMYYCGYTLSDDNMTVKGMDISYYPAYQGIEYSIDQIPSAAELFFLYSTIYENYSFCIFSDHMDSNLEKAVIYTDDRVISNIEVYSEQDNPNDMWRITISDEDMLSIYSLDSITLKLTIDGKNEVIDISRETTPYIFDMVNWIVGVRLYSNTTYENYRSTIYLPGGLAEPAVTPEIEQTRTYSFREDYENIDLAAKSLFYVEKFDDNFECISSASGFVAFDMHSTGAATSAG